MEEHFLAHMMKGKPSFKAEPWYNPYGDCVVYKIANEAAIADRIDELLTIYRSAEDDRAIGFQIKGVLAIIKKFGYSGLRIASKCDTELKSVSIAALLLAAYEDGPQNLARRISYAEAMEFPSKKRTICVDELQPA